MQARLSSASSPLPLSAERAGVRDFRNRIAHGDEDIADGKAGKGLATATLRPEATGISIQDVRLDYSDLARMLEQTHDYLRAAIWKGGRSRAAEPSD